MSNRPGDRRSTGPSADTRRSDVSTKWAVDRLDDRERRFSFVAATVTVVFGITLYVLETHEHHHGASKSQLSPEWTLLLSVVLGGLLVGATYLGRRAPVGFVALFIGAMFGESSLFLGLPFFILAFWLLWRSYKIQRDSAALAKAARTGSARPNTRATAAVAADDEAPDRPAPPPRANTGTTKNARRRGPAAPEANKRFTPKRPPPAAPKPSRRERKAANTSD